MTEGKKMKTTKQIADELGVSKQQVYRYIKKHNIKEARQENGTMYYDDAAEHLITQGFSEKTKSSETEQKHTTDTALETVILMLRKELEAKDRQIEALQKALDQEQQLHAATMKQIEPPKTLELEAPKPEKKGWFSKWKKK
jgi:predicted DNA-binding transcriptional regulator YafY